MRISILRTYLRQRGFALIGVLLLMLIVSGLAVSVSYLTIREKKVSGSDQDNNIALYGAEGGLEKISSDLTYLYQQKMSPLQSDLDNLSANKPTLPGIAFSEYKVAPTNGSMTPVVATLSSGANAGLNALMVKLTSSVTAQAPGTSQVRMVRNLEVALIPVFQFGMFSDTDLTFHNGPDMDFNGRIHTNANLYLVPNNSGSATFHDKISAVLDVIRLTLPTGGSSTGYTGPVAIPTTANGCAPLQAKNNASTSTCRLLGTSEGSVANSGWYNLSTNTYHSMVINGSTGAKTLQLPFVNGGAKPIEIIRQPPAGESPTSAVGLSRYFNEAQIRVLLDDTLAALPAECQNKEADGIHFGTVELDSTALTFPANVTGYTNSSPVAGSKFAVGNHSKDANWVPTSDVSLLDTATWNSTTHTTTYVPTFLCVLGKNTAGAFFPVTNEWLRLGFEKNNAAHVNAILHLQQHASTEPAGYQAWPINLYDTREGEYRDVTTGKAAATCAINGIMNLVEIDVGNLTRWLTDATGKGPSIDNTPQNGYILYFSDRRGMLRNPNAAPVNSKNGESGLEDVLNLPASNNGARNGVLDGPTGKTIGLYPLYAEDVDQNGFLDNWGSVNLGLGFNQAYNADPGQTRVTAAIAQQNVTAGPRHALRLVDAASGKLPSRSGQGGFTVASEQPVYVLGNYNSNSSDGPVNGETWSSAHVAASVVADAVTLLSNSWNDVASFTSPFTPGNRLGSETWYRMAIAAGKSQAFNSSDATLNFGGDGGVHNFLRYLEQFPGSPALAVHYRGSMVSFYFSQYATGIYKCCTTVYGPPTRSYSFDTDFLDIAKMPPGTPLFRDVENVGGHQDFTAQ